MARTTDYLDHLGRVPLFAACNKKDLQRIARASVEVNVPAGKVLMTEGDVGREAFVIIGGNATVRRNGRKVASYGPGDFFGEMALLDKGPRTATVTADSDMDLLVLGQREFSGVLDEVPGLSHRVLTALAGRLRVLDAKVYG